MLGSNTRASSPVEQPEPAALTECLYRTVPALVAFVLLVAEIRVSTLRHRSRENLRHGFGFDVSSANEFV